MNSTLTLVPRRQTALEAAEKFNDVFFHLTKAKSEYCFRSCASKLCPRRYTTCQDKVIQKITMAEFYLSEAMDVILDVDVKGYTSIHTEVKDEISTAN